METGMTLDTLSKILGVPAFKPMNRMDWMTFSGANPGTYIAYDEAGYRVAFAEPTGDVNVNYAGPDYAGDDEINVNVGPLTGFSAEAVAANAAYHASVTPTGLTAFEQEMERDVAMMKLRGDYY